MADDEHCDDYEGADDGGYNADAAGEQYENDDCGHYIYNTFGYTYFL